MPATPRKARALALALAGLGITASTMSAVPATAATGGSTSDNASTTTTAKKTQRTAPVSAKRRVANRVLTARDIAMRQRGDAYAYGAAGPDRFDCSGLVNYAFRAVGKAVPRTSSQLRATTKPVSRAAAVPGDLVFSPGHVGIYVSPGVMVDAPNSGGVVSVRKIYARSYTIGRIV